MKADLDVSVDLDNSVRPCLADPKTSWWSLSVAAKGGQAVLGQGFFAGAHFLANILLARCLPPAQYGIFALAYASFLLLSMLYCGFMYEPVIVYGSGRYADQFGSYMGLLLRTTYAMLIPASLTILVASLVIGHFYSRDVSRAFVALALAAPPVLTTWLGRARLYAQLNPSRVAVGGGIYFCVLAGLLFAFLAGDMLSPSTTFLGMGAAGLLTSSFFLFQVRAPETGTKDLKIGPVVRDHWHYGRWAIAAYGAAWFPDNIYYTLLAARGGLGGTAALRALVNLASPATQTLAALSAVLIPVLVRRSRQGGILRMKKTASFLLLLLVPGCVLYAGLLWLCRTTLFRVLYSGRYEQYSGWSLFIVALLPLSTTASTVFGAGLRALENPQAVFWCYITASAATVLVGLPLALRLGVSGAACGLLISSLATAVSMAWFFRRSANKKAESLESQS